jgi:hypothetical protein
LGWWDSIWLIWLIWLVGFDEVGSVWSVGVKLKGAKQTTTNQPTATTQPNRLPEARQDGAIAHKRHQPLSLQLPPERVGVLHNLCMP